MGLEHTHTLCGWLRDVQLTGQDYAQCAREVPRHVSDSTRFVDAAPRTAAHGGDAGGRGRCWLRWSSARLTRPCRRSSRRTCGASAGPTGRGWRPWTGWQRRGPELGSGRTNRRGGRCSCRRRGAGAWGCGSGMRVHWPRSRGTAEGAAALPALARLGGRLRGGRRLAQPRVARKRPEGGGRDAAARTATAAAGDAGLAGAVRVPFCVSWRRRSEYVTPSHAAHVRQK